MNQELFDQGLATRRAVTPSWGRAVAPSWGGVRRCCQGRCWRGEFGSVEPPL